MERAPLLGEAHLQTTQLQSVAGDRFAELGLDSLHLAGLYPRLILQADDGAVHGHGLLPGLAEPRGQLLVFRLQPADVVAQLRVALGTGCPDPRDLDVFGT